MKTIYNPESAYFLTQDKTIISAVVTEIQEDGRPADFTRTIEVSPNPLFNEFIDQVSLEKVEENTQREIERQQAEYNKNERKLIDKIKKEIQQDLNVVAQPDSTNTATFDINNVSTEDLFKVKLQAFEISEVRESKNRTLKAKIRKADNFMGVLSYTVATILDNQEE